MNNIKEINGYVVYSQNGINYPIKKINTPYSKFSKARWLKTSQITKSFKPSIKKDNSIGPVMYYVFEDSLIVPATITHSF